MCNLTEVNVVGFVENGVLDRKGLYEAQGMSARAGYRMACIDFELHKWDAINKEDMLTGTGLTGWQDMVNAANLTVEDEIEIMQELRAITDRESDALADSLGRNRSALKTTIKPSGSLSQLPGVASGLHFSHSPYYVRRVRINSGDPLVKVVKELGYPIFPEVGQDLETGDTVVIEFPMKSPEGRTKYDVSAIEQLEIYKRFMDNFIQHNGSITVHVRPNEWDEVEEWCYEHWDELIAVSFLALDDSFYQLMPYEAITKEEYKERFTAMKPFNPNLLQKYETQEMELDLGDEDCST